MAHTKKRGESAMTEKRNNLLLKDISQQYGIISCHSEELDKFFLHLVKEQGIAPQRNVDMFFNRDVTFREYFSEDRAYDDCLVRGIGSYLVSRRDKDILVEKE